MSPDLPVELRILQPSAVLLDPHVWTDDKDRLSIRYAIYEALVSYDKEGSYQPALAEVWNLADDAQTWSFRIRSGVRFHNGDELNAHAVVAALDRARGPGVAGELGTSGLYRSYLGNATVQAVDDLTIRIVTVEPMADLLDLLIEIPIISGAPVSGTGPYRVVDATADGVLLEAHDRYWGNVPSAGRVWWKAEPDEQRRVEALLAGQADLVANLSSAGVSAVSAASQCDVISRESKWATIFMCNAAAGVCQDKRVRQALNYALDVPEIIEVVMGGAGRPLNGPLTELHFGHDPATAPYPFDPARAQALLAEAGHGEGLRLVLDVPTVVPDEALQLGKAMAEQYTRVGIVTDVRVHTDRPGYAEMVKAKQMGDACCFDSSPLSSWRVLREKFHSGIRGVWWQGYCNPEVDALLDRAAATVNAKSRQAVYRHAYSLIRDDAPWIYLYSPVMSWGLGPQARGVRIRFDSTIQTN
jgi:peptide/nickel transport system substrate-binding protein